ncbi:hypothetical protein Tco_0905729 [Tanacetum coccineum]
MTSVVSRVILFGTILTKISIVPDMPTNLPTAPEVPVVSPFLCPDDFEFESADESLERHVSLRPYDDMVSRWRDRVRFHSSSPSGSSSLDTTILSIEIATASLACISTPVIIASPAVRSHIQTTVRQSTLGLQPVMTPARSVTLSRARRARRAALSLKTSSSDTSSESSSDLALASFSSAGPSRKRSRYRGTSAMHSDESSDEGSPVAQAESGIEPVVVGVETSFALELAVGDSESEPEEAEADKEADAKVQPEDTIEIAVDVATGFDIPNDFLMPDAIERLGQLEEGMKEQEGRNLIADSERSGLLSRVVTLEGSNTRLQDALVIERVRAGSLQRRLGYVEDELRQNGGNGGAKRDAPVARLCTYKDFLNCQPYNFSGTEGVVGLARLFEKMELVFCISNCSPNSQVKFAAFTLLNGALTWWNSHVHTVGIDEAYEIP